MASHNSEPAKPVDTSAGYEQTDIKFSAVAITMILMVITTIIAIILMKWMDASMAEARISVLKTTPSTMAEHDSFTAHVDAVAAPRLQSEPKIDLTILRSHEEAIVKGYGWIDHDHRIAHIPVEEAMKQIAENGLPVWKPSAATGASH